LKEDPNFFAKLKKGEEGEAEEGGRGGRRGGMKRRREKDRWTARASSTTTLITIHCCHLSHHHHHHHHSSFSLCPPSSLSPSPLPLPPSSYTGQQPEYLFIGCSDSRVPAQEIMGLKAGEVFITRNVANMVVNTDLSLLTVLQYSVHELGVKDIIVCGHYGCGGVKAAMMKFDHGIMEPWLRNIRDVQRLHKKELTKCKTADDKWNKLVELNVQVREVEGEVKVGGG